MEIRWLLAHDKKEELDVIARWAHTLRSRIVQPGHSVRVVTARAAFIDASRAGVVKRGDWSGYYAWLLGSDNWGNKRFHGVVRPWDGKPFGRGTSDTVEAFIGARRYAMAWSPLEDWLRPILGVNLIGDDNYFQWSWPRIQGMAGGAGHDEAAGGAQRNELPPPPLPLSPGAGGRKDVDSESANGDYQDFIAFCAGVIGRAECLLDEKPRGEEFFASVIDKLGSMADGAEQRRSVTDPMWEAARNMERGVSRWED